MNDRNDLFAGQIEGWAESNADEIYYCGQVKPAPRAVNRQGERNADVYSHFNGKLGTDESGRNYTSDDEAVDALSKNQRMGKRTAFMYVSWVKLSTCSIPD